MANNLENTCRCCYLSDNKHLLVMSECQLVGESDSKIVDSYFEMCVDSTRATLGPFKICSSCNQTLQTCIRFRTMCQKSNEQFQRDWIKKERGLYEPNIIYNEKRISNKYSVSEVLIAQIKSEAESDGDDNTDLHEQPQLKKMRLSSENQDVTENLKEDTVSVGRESESNSEVHKCLNCYQKFATDKLLRHHITFIHVRFNSESWMCRECGLEFKNVKELDEHLQKLHPKVSIFFPCFFCKRTNTSIRKLKVSCKAKCAKRRKAYRKRRGTPATINCDCCNLKFHEVDEMDCHKITLRNREAELKERYLCEQCNIRFLLRQEYSKHLKNVHKQKTVSNKPSAMCSVCGKMFLSKDRLKKHSTVHVQTRDFKCDVCSATFKDNYRLYCHKKIHSQRVKKFQCNECGRQFDMLYCLRHHLLRLHFPSARPYSCKICGKALTTANEKLKHEKKHQGERSFSCHMCTKTYTTDAGLQNHIQVHHTSIRYECKVCDKKLANKNSMWKHIFSHRGFYPFNCPICNYGCYPKELMRRHLKTKHEVLYDEKLHGYHKETKNEVVASGIKINEQNAGNFRQGVTLIWDLDFLNRKAMENANVVQGRLDTE